MNQKTDKKLAAEMSPRTRIVSYAPVASTRGNRVKIYRYGFDRMSAEYRNMLECEQHPLRKAVIRYKWAGFILNHIEEYAGNKEIFRRSAGVLVATAYLEAKQILTEAEQSIHKAKERLHRARKRAGIKHSSQASETSRGLTAKQRQEIEALRYDLRLCRKRHDELLAICPDTIFERIREMAESQGSHNR